jgi:hypothetical protein
MTHALKKGTFILVNIAVALAIVIAITPIVRADDGEAQVEAVPVTTEAEARTTEENQEAAPEAEAFNFTAQPGDSYTKMARKATQIYGIDTQTELSGAQIVFVETNVTIEAGSPELNVGEEVSINKSTVESWVNKAKELTDEQKANWQVYADQVDFNTNGVGEAPTE